MGRAAILDDLTRARSPPAPAAPCSMDIRSMDGLVMEDIPVIGEGMFRPLGSFFLPPFQNPPQPVPSFAEEGVCAAEPEEGICRDIGLWRDSSECLAGAPVAVCGGSRFVPPGLVAPAAGVRGEVELAMADRGDPDCPGDLAVLSCASSISVFASAITRLDRAIFSDVRSDPCDVSRVSWDLDWEIISFIGDA